jgi:hypothetical protein
MSTLNNRACHSRRLIALETITAQVSAARPNNLTAGSRDPLRNQRWPGEHGAKWLAGLLTDASALVLAAAPRLPPSEDHAADGTRPPGDLHGAPDYRRHLARVLTGRALAAAAGI